MKKHRAFFRAAVIDFAVFIGRMVAIIKRMFNASSLAVHKKNNYLSGPREFPLCARIAIPFIPEVSNISRCRSCFIAAAQVAFSSCNFSLPARFSMEEALCA